MENNNALEAIDTAKMNNLQQTMNTMESNCALHRSGIESKIEQIDIKINTQVDNLDRAFKPGGVIHDMNEKLNQIDKRLFRSNGTRSLVEEIRNQGEELKDHLDKHKSQGLRMGQYAFLITSIIIGSSLGTVLTAATNKFLLDDNSQNTTTTRSTYTTRSNNSTDIAKEQ